MAARPDDPPQRPVLGALAVVLKDNHVLLARRGRPPLPDHWGYPGGHVEWGETALEAAVRELREETCLIATPQAYLTNLDARFHDPDGQLVSHYLLAAVACTLVGGTLRARDDIVDAQWVPVDEVQAGHRPMHDGVQEVLDMALRRRRDQIA